MDNLIQPTIEAVRRPRRWPWFAVVIVLVVAASVVGWYVRGVNVPVSDDSTLVEVTINEGSSVEDIIATLDAQGFIRSSLVFKLHARFSGVASQLKAGTYALQQS